MATRYKIKTKVAMVEQKSRCARMVKTDQVDAMGKPIYDAVIEDLGWYVAFEGSRESLFISMDKPPIVIGQPATIVIEL